MKMKVDGYSRCIVGNPIFIRNPVASIPADTFHYRLGNRSALEWVIDQYQLTKDARTGITSDPNRPDDPEYIVRLVRQVITTSLQTNKIVNALPADFGG
jgi:predicted helicase